MIGISSSYWYYPLMVQILHLSPDHCMSSFSQFLGVYLYLGCHCHYIVLHYFLISPLEEVVLSIPILVLVQAAVHFLVRPQLRAPVVQKFYPSRNRCFSSFSQLPGFYLDCHYIVSHYFWISQLEVFPYGFLTRPLVRTFPLPYRLRIYADADADTDADADLDYCYFRTRSEAVMAMMTAFSVDAYRLRIYADADDDADLEHCYCRMRHSSFFHSKAHSFWLGFLT
mmetsp:Transcript_25372/g.38785  ORF Transcript_25372/g.38785 Transcript_25372/m.38785 type:complete len:226 (-) Transcript_25372:467-1144(-)